MNNINDRLDKIMVPERLNTAIKASIMKGKKDKKKRRFQSMVIKCSSTVAILFLAFCICINSIPTFASSIKNIPLLSQLVNVLKFHFDDSIEKSAEHGLNQNITLSKSDNGIKFTIDDVIADNTKIVLVYTLEVEKGYETLQNLLIKDFKIKDNNNNLLVSSEGSNGVTTTWGKNGSNYYKVLQTSVFNNLEGLVTSPEKLNKDFIKTHKSQGTLEIYPRYNEISVMPEEINVEITKLVETYYEPKEEATGDSKQFTEDAFKKKNGRDAISINGNWSFNIKLNEELKNIEPTSFSCDAAFNIGETAFNIESVKASPLRTDVKITWTDKDKVFEVLSFKSHLEDDMGNRYERMRLKAYAPTHTITGVFESNYYDTSENLYLVIDEVSYQYSDNRDDVIKASPVKIKIK